MHRTKTDVDRHVQELFRKIKSAHERHLKCYNIAKLYYKVGAYGAAKRHALMYLSVQENNDNAHQLLGDCHEKLGEIDRAIAEYKRSLELDPNQPGLILKMCDLMSQLSLSNLNVGRAHYWCEKGAEHFPNNPIISRLRQKIIITEDTDPKALENFYLSESRNRPNDVNVLIQLLNLYLDSGRSLEAYNKAMEYEDKQAFRLNLEWYRCLSRICMACREDAQSRLSEPMLKNMIEIYDRCLMALHPAANVPFDESISNLYLLDQTLNAANETLVTNDQFDREFMAHYSAQLSFHIALVLLKRASQESLSWTDAVRCASPALLFALASPPDLDLPITQDPKQKRKLKHMVDKANYRIVQVTLTLLNWAKGFRQEDFIGKILHYYSKNFREHIFNRVFLKQTQRKDAGTSYWQNSNAYLKLPTSIPDLTRILTKPILLSFENHNRDSLHNMIWLGLQIVLLSTSPKSKLILPPQFSCQTLTKFPFSHPNLSTSNIETLSKLDVDTFLYIAVLSNYLLIEDQISSGSYTKDRPNTLPADITNSLQSEEQAKFWTAICKLQSNNLNDNFNDLRSVLVQGIEVVRLMGNHGLDVQMVVSIARIFESHSKCTAKENAVPYESRALLYWNKAVKMLESAERRPMMTPSKNRNRFFNYPTVNYPTSLSATEVSNLLEEGRLFIACDLMRKEEYDKAISAFKPLRSPFASFNQALIFKKLAFNEINCSVSEEVTSAMRSKHIILLTKARDALFLTRDKIQSDYDHPLHAALKLELDSIESQLARLDTESVTTQSDDYDRAPSLSSVESAAGDSLPPTHSTFYESAQLSNSIGAPLTPTSYDAIRQYGVDRSTLNDSYVSTIERNEFKQLTKIHSKTLSLVESLCKRIEKIETDISTIKKTSKKNDRNVEEILAKIYLKPNTSTTNDDSYFPQEELDDYVDDLSYSYANYRSPVPSAYGMQMAQHQSMYQPKLPPTNFPAQPMPPLLTSPYFPAGLPPNSLFPNPTAQPITAQQLTQPLAAQPLAGQPLAAPTIPPFFPQSTALPFSEGQKLPDFMNTPKMPLSMGAQNLPPEAPVIPDYVPPVSKNALPNNVVITKSDTLPTGSPPIQPTLSVTIPPQHLNSGRPKQVPPAHSFHIALPSAESTSPKPAAPAQPTVTKDQALSGSKINVGGLTFSSQPIIKPVEAEEKQSEVVSSAPATPPNPFAHLTFKSTVAPTTPDLTQMFSKANIFGPAAVSTAAAPTSSSVSVTAPFSFSTPSAKSDSPLKSILKDSPVSQTTDPQKHVAFKASGENDTPLFGKTSLDFSALAAKSADSPFKVSDSFKGFDGQGSKLFESVNSPSDKSPNTTVDNAEDFVPTAEFKPVIALPDLVEVKTGEEDLKVLYEERCKLLRFDSELKEWKERGIGKMKLLHDPVTNHVRLLMRREQVLKVCCNQRLTDSLKLTPVASSDKAWNWCGHDFSEQEGKLETFAVRFKNSELAKEFYDAVEKAKALVVDQSGNTPPKAAANKAAPGNTKSKKDVPLSELFKPKAGSWECKDCYTRNESDKVACVACNARNPDAPEGAVPVVTSPFSLGLPSVVSVTSASGGFTFGIPPNATTTASAPSTTVSAPAPVTSGFTFGTPKPFSFAPASTPAASTPASFSFGINGTSKQETFGDKGKSQNGLDLTKGKQEIDHSKTNGGGFDFNAASTPSGFEFGSGNAKGFSFTLKQNKSPRSPGTRNSESEPEYDEVSEADDSADNIYFQPVIPLPDKIIPKTGEEDEIVLYQHLAKLYRYRDSEWKERGTGDIKLLKHRTTGRLRFVMRRKPVEVLCLNHFLTPDIEIKPKDRKSWTWTAQDFSDYNEFDRSANIGLKPEVFSIRFKNEQIAEEFKAAVDKALKDVASGDSSAEEKSSSDDYCEIVWESRGIDATEVSEKDKKLAKDLQLPASFYKYKTAPPCPGCIGCDKDDSEESYSPSQNDSAKKSGGTSIFGKPTLTPTNTSQTVDSSVNSYDSPSSNPGSLFSESSFTDTNRTTPVSSSIFGGTGAGGLKPSSLFGGDPKTPPSDDAPVSIFGGSGQKSIFGGLGQGQPVFGSSAQPLFGSSSNQSSKGSVFGSANQSPLFGTPTTQSSLFGGSTDQSKSSVFSTTGSVFGGLQNSPSGSIFGGTQSNTSGSIFGGSQNNTSGSIFGGTQSNTSGSIFGGSQNSTSGSIFGGSQSSTSGSIFGGSQNSVVATPDSETKTSESDPNFTLKTSGISFASLAANTSTFAADKGSKPFAFEGSGSAVFGAVSSTTGNESHNQSENAENEGDDDHYDENEHDPHYEPIVPLPDKIEVRTGEEGEDKLFVQRAKLYRYETSSKQWKERGTGEMKVLKDPVNLTYRLLLRRDQVHKVVCNVRITPNLELLPMQLSPNAFMFFAHNLGDDYQEPVLEQLAVKFKNETILNQFKDTVTHCITEIEEIKKNNSTLNSTVENSSFNASTGEVEEGEVAEGEEEEGAEGDGEEYEDYGGEEVEDEEAVEEEYDDEDEVLFIGRAAVLSRASKKSSWAEEGDGDICIYSNFPYSYVSLSVEDPTKAVDSEIVNTGVAIEPDAVVERKGLALMWTGSTNSNAEGKTLEYMTKFQTKEAATEFYTSFVEAKETAKQAMDKLAEG
ncbi:unnamed protein product [Bemisia tabaci]|uniref:E3 SUMO-protein ligase RanBP2 n=1 Tax=Bemisia tabaci TaxID=7038 RepID=A0A9P0AKH6_BEMTA|nr:unnamed protein product [Bemisia tabaci]